MIKTILKSNKAIIGLKELNNKNYDKITGKEIIPCIYDYYNNLENGFVTIEKDNKIYDIANMLKKLDKVIESVKE